MIFGQGEARPQGDNLLVDDLLDLDGFLDNYLIQLQNDNSQIGRGGQIPFPVVQGQQPTTENQSPHGTTAPAAPAQSLDVQNLYLMQQLQAPSSNLMPHAPLDMSFGAGNVGMAPLGFPNDTSFMPGLDGMLPQDPSSDLAPSSSKARKGMQGRGRGRDTGSRQRKGVNAIEQERDGSSSDLQCDLSDSGSDDCEPRSNKRPATSNDLERRQLALQEKNRRAQRKFRERQKNKLKELQGQIEELTSKVSGLHSENASLQSRTSILEKVLDMRNEQIQAMQETKESPMYSGVDEELVLFHGLRGHLVRLTPDMIKELSSEQIYKIYQMYVKELGVRLQELESSGEDSPEIMEEMDRLCKDLCMIIMRLGVIKPLETRKFIVVSRQYLGSTEADIISLWRHVIKSTNLSEEQKREVVELKRMFLQKIDPIMEERQALNLKIQSNLPHDTFHTKSALTYMKAHEAVVQLRENLRAEQHIVLEFAISVFRGVFKPKQLAQLLTKCYPAAPDALGIASALASEMGEPDTQNRRLALHLGSYLEKSQLAASSANSLARHPLDLMAPGVAIASAANAGNPMNGQAPSGAMPPLPGFPFNPVQP